MEKQIIEILKRYDVYDFKIDNMSIQDVIECLEDALYDYGDETCSWDCTIIDNYNNAIKELQEMKG